MKIKKMNLWTKQDVRAIGALACVATLSALCLSGCMEDNDRKPTAAEGKAADTKRLSYIDSLNISPEQKAIMKSHMGGPSVASPADAARQKVGKDAPAKGRQ